MAERSPKHGLTRNERGWVKRINHKPKWICSDKIAPTADAADDFYEKNFSDLWQPAVNAPESISLAVTCKYLCDGFYDRKSRAGIDPRTLADYDSSAKDFLAVVGKDRHPDELTSADFAKVRAAWAGRFGPDRLNKFVINIRTMFRWALKPPLRLREPDYGDEFEIVSKVEFRRDRKTSRDTHGRKFFEPADITKLLAKSNPNLRAMILLALNGGFGNTDVADLPLSVVNLKSGWLDYARGKTGIDRRVPLWPETIKALGTAIDNRAVRMAKRQVEGLPLHPGADKLVFVTRQGRPYIVDKTSSKESGALLHKDGVATAFAKLVDACDLVRTGRGFYSLRRTHRTLADELGDGRAADLIMGHATDGDMGGTYVQAIGDERLLKLVNHVREKLGFNIATAPAAKKKVKDVVSSVKTIPASRSRLKAPRR